MEETVRAALREIKDPISGQDVVNAGVIEAIAEKNRNVHVTMVINPKNQEVMESVRIACEKRIMGLDGVLSATVVMTAESAGGKQAQAGTASARQSADHSGLGKIVAVASGKGGVGKSTTATNLALSLVARGKRVGILDADIYGPSLPRLLGISGKPRSRDGKKLIPMENHGVKTMSMGFLVEEDSPMIWRGPMVQSALQQMITDVEWGDLDVLVVDMPPGTGDAQLTMAQKVPLAGAVIVSTPQDLALLDARKAINMFRKVEVPILGLIENMSYFACPHCGEHSHIFGHGGAKACAAQYGIDFLGAIPLEMDIRETSDGGRPIVTSMPSSSVAKAYLDCVDGLIQRLSQSGRAAPAIQLN